MATWDNIAHNVKDTLESLTEGWQELWSKARNSITHFTPNSDDDAPTQRSAWGVMSAEMQETDAAVVVSIEAPGMESGDFNIRVEGNPLSISGKRSYSKQREQGRYHITERAYGSFQRTISLPCEVDDSKSTAKYKYGVLEISLPKSVTLQPRRITIETG
jgi:HSP20 family protein